MLSVYKYQVEESPYCELELPKDAIPLRLDYQTYDKTFGEFYLWALVDPSQPGVKRRFRFVGTGQPIKHEPSELKFINTILLNGGSEVVHFFEVLSPMESYLRK